MPPPSPACGFSGRSVLQTRPRIASTLTRSFYAAQNSYASRHHLSIFLLSSSRSLPATSCFGNVGEPSKSRSQFPALPTCIQVRALKSIAPVRRNKYNNHPDRPLLGSTPAAALQRKIKANVLPLRTGAIAIKTGMTGHYDSETGVRQPCTVLQLDRNQVVGLKTRRQYGYWAVVMGAGAKSGGNTTRAELGNFAKYGVPVKRHVVEFRVDGRPSEEAGVGGMGKDEKIEDVSLGGVRIGDQVGADLFRVGQFVDTRSNTKGHGFTGVMKRHGMKGQDASHGVSLTHRSLGSAGAGQGSGSRVHPGKRMAGRMGNERNTIQNLRVLQVDVENGLIVVNGPVSGPKGCIVSIQDAIKKPFPKPDPIKPRMERSAAILQNAASPSSNAASAVTV